MDFWLKMIGIVMCSSVVFVVMMYIQNRRYKKAELKYQKDMMYRGINLKVEDSNG